MEACFYYKKDVVVVFSPFQLALLKFFLYKPRDKGWNYF